MKASQTRSQFRNWKFAAIFLVSLGTLAACVSVNKQTVENMPTARLCDFLRPKWVTLPAEEAAIFDELERRDARCSNSNVAYESPKERKKRKKGKKGEKGKDGESEDDDEEGGSGGSGSGVVIDAQGTVLTNQHVVNGCKKLEAVHNGNRYRARLIAQDATNDVAVLRFAAKTPVFGSFRVRPRMKLAEPVMVLGYPLPSVLSHQIHATTGDVTALAGIHGDTRFLQISAPIQPGNSGGPIVDQSGLVVGIATAKLDEVTMARATGNIPQNVNFGLKVSAILDLLDSYKIDYTVGKKTRDLSKPDLAEKISPSVVWVLCDID